MLYTAGKPSVLWLLGKPHSELPRLCKVEGNEGGLAKQASERGRKSVATGQPNSKAQRAGPYVEQMVPGEGWNHVA